MLAGRADPVEAVRGDPVAILPCGRSLSGARAAEVTRLESAVEAVASEWGHVVVDCPAGLRADAGVPLAVADLALVVSSPRRFALADALRTRELARELGADLTGGVLNRVVEAAPTAAARRALGAPVTAVPADPRLGRSIRENQPVVVGHPESEAAAAIRRVADRVRACLPAGQGRRSV